MKAASLSGSLTPGAASTPEATSTAYGRDRGDPLGDVLRRSGRRRGSAGTLRAMARGERPVPGLARAAAQPARRGVEQVEVRVEALEVLEVGRAGASRTALITFAPVRRPASAQNAGPSSPCSWTWVRWSASAACATSSSVALTNTPTSSTRRRSAAAMPAADGGVGRARRARPEDEAERPRAELDGELGVLEAGDAADLDARHARASRRGPPPRRGRHARRCAAAAGVRRRRRAVGERTLAARRSRARHVDRDLVARRVARRARSRRRPSSAPRGRRSA